MWSLSAKKIPVYKKEIESVMNLRHSCNFKVKLLHLSEKLKSPKKKFHSVHEFIEMHNVGGCGEKTQVKVSGERLD